MMLINQLPTTHTVNIKGGKDMPYQRRPYSVSILTFFRENY